MIQSLAEMAVEVLTTADGRAKTALAHKHAAAWRASRDGSGPEIAVGQAGDFYFPVRAGGQGIGNGIAQAIAAFQGDFPGQGDQYQLIDAHDLEKGLVGEALGR